MQALRPIESEPLDVALDRVDVLHPLLCRVRIVEAQVAAAAEFLRKLVIQYDRLRVPQGGGRRSARMESASPRRACGRSRRQTL